MKRILIAFTALLFSMQASAQFTAGQVLSAAQLNSALAAKTNNASAAITGGTIAGLSSPLPLASGGTGATSAAGALAALGAAPTISANATLNVPSQFSTIQAALNYLNGFMIAPGVAVTIQVADGTYVMPATLVVSHPNGQNIHIIGDVANPAGVVLDYSTANTDGVNVATGYALGELNGFTVKGKGAIVTGSQNIHFGVYTYGGQFNKLGPNVVVDGFYYGVSALNGGTIYCNGSDATTNRLEVKNSGDVGIWAISGSFVSCVYAYVHDSADSTANLGGGIIAEFGSAIVANNAKASNNYLVNIASQSGSGVRAWNGAFDHAGTLSNATTNPNTSSVANVITNSLGAMELFGSTVSNSLGYGDSSDGTGQLFGGVGSSTYTSNALGNSRQPATYSNSAAALTLNDYGNSNATLTINAPNDANGATIKLIGNGGTNPNKYIQVFGGSFNVISSNYATPILKLSDGGLLTTPGGYQLPVTTVASLPTCGTSQKGLMYAVSDATAPTYNGALTGGGAVSVPVYCNGTAWTSH
jgi:hypothetical protein